MKIKLALLATVLMFTLSCSRETDSTGDILIYFQSDSEIQFQEISCRIYLLYESNIELLHSLRPDSEGLLVVNNLIEDSYLIKYNYDGSNGSSAFQIIGGLTKEIYIDL